VVFSVRRRLFRSALHSVESGGKIGMHVKPRAQFWAGTIYFGCQAKISASLQRSISSFLQAGFRVLRTSYAKQNFFNA